MHPLVWYVLLRAMDRFHSEKGRFPGTNDLPRAADSADLKRQVVALVEETKVTVE